jgi:hypothetical protein
LIHEVCKLADQKFELLKAGPAVVPEKLKD